MVLSKRTHFILILILLFLFFGCREKVTAPESIAFGILSTYEGCKSFVTTSSSGSNTHGINEECIEYEYDGEELLVLKHINSGFNCCPEKIAADIFVTGNMIYIEERELDQGCLCQCLFDVKYEVHDLKPGEYTIAVKAPYTVESDEEMKCNVSLYGSCSGTYCVSRAHYPWDNSK